MIKIALLLLSALISPAREYQHPLVEFNVVCSETGNYRFQQVIFWDKYEGLNALHVRSYVMMDNSTVWFPGKNETIIVHKGETYRAKHTKFTVTNYDPEEKDRVWVPLNERKY